MTRTATLMHASARGRPLFLAEAGTVMLPLPRAPAGAGPLVVALASGGGGQEAARWRFDAARPDANGYLVLSASHLDQAFVTLNQPGAPPTADFWIDPRPRWADPLELLVGWFGAAVPPPSRYELRWPSDEARDRALTAWTLQQIHPAEWFYVEITTHCNLRCPFCPSKDLARARSSMSLDTARTIFGRIGAYVAQRDTAPNGYVQMNRMVFLHVMGEPLLHPKLVEIASIARAAGLVPALLTNVTLLNDRNVDRLLASGLGHVTLSLNAPTEQDFRALGGHGSQREQERRVMRFLAARAAHDGPVPHVDIQYMMRRDRAVAGPDLLHSREEMWDLYRRWLCLVREAQPPLCRSVEPRPQIDPAVMMAPLRGFGEDPSARLPLQPGIDFVVKTACTFGNVALAPGFVVHPVEDGQCPYHNPFRQLAVFVDGSVSFCNLDHENTVNLGSLLDTPVQEIWTSPRMQRIRDAMLSGRLSEPLCQRCMGRVEEVGTVQPVAG